MIELITNLRKKINMKHFIIIGAFLLTLCHNGLAMKQVLCKIPSESNLLKRLGHLGGHRMRSFVEETTLVKDLARQEISVDSIAATVKASLEDFYKKSKSIVPASTNDRRLLYAEEDNARVLAALLYDQEELPTYIKRMDEKAKICMTDAVDHYFRRWAFCEQCGWLAERIAAIYGKLENPQAMDAQQALKILIDITGISHENDEMRLTPISIEFHDRGFSEQYLSSYRSEILPKLKCKVPIIQICTDVVVTTIHSGDPSMQDALRNEREKASPLLDIFIYDELQKLRKLRPKDFPTKILDSNTKE